jgi:hypothetical protein
MLNLDVQYNYSNSGLYGERILLKIFSTHTGDSTVLDEILYGIDGVFSFSFFFWTI